MVNIDKLYYRGYIKIDLDVIYNNVCQIKKIVSDNTKIIAVIKADAYGYGMLTIAETIKDKVYAYAVATIDEALTLREKITDVPIYILGFIPEDKIKDAINNDIRMTVYEVSQAERISQYAKEVRKNAIIHIKLDTGMGRLGFLVKEQSIASIEYISNLENIFIEGIFTHFSKADEDNSEYTDIQISKFQNVILQLKERDIDIPIIHCCNSAGIIRFPEAHMSAVRMGIILYGMYPSEVIEKYNIGISNGLEWKSHIVYIKDVDKNASISYGGTYITRHKTKIATIPIGYADGYPRLLSNKGHVLVKGKKVPVIGRVCMDQFMVDVSDIDDVSEGDVVTLIGIDGDEKITVEELASYSNTINYEFVCDIGKRMPRVYYSNGKIVQHMNYFSNEFIYA